ncbi:hypothetical protein [Chondromyces crocatus]|uniref:Uncharacterized protein n=1 Tax=Chondromyces crocatus TaxID=52 RepID=A0A0K1ESX8_CHOCO|nr:hypothetical protein [Chondromyces crocatus]AKT43904.1 uncharacterized protein CMC5_081410 [Chondromyces crocatus]
MSHASAHLDDLGANRFRLWLRSPWGAPDVEFAYKVDQAFAQAHVPYFPIAAHAWHTGLEVAVPEPFAAQASAIQHRFEEDLPRPHTSSPGRGFRRDLLPQRLSKSHADHPWVFCHYQEKLPDGRQYQALLFRDQKRTTFGRREWVLPATGGRIGEPAMRKLAWRIVMDPELRNELLSDDPSLHDFWP